jgi:hypothetical protein
MKLHILSLFALIALALGARMPQKQVIVSYPDNTPDSVLDKAKDAIKEAGGIITHEYKIIKYALSISLSEIIHGISLTLDSRGFAAQAPAKVLEAVQIMGNDYHAIIEEDQMVSVSGNGE